MPPTAMLRSVPFVRGMAVSELGFGAAEIGNLYRAVSDEEAFVTLDAAASAGVTLFDTSPFYGHGLSELRLGQFLRNRRRDSFILSTKVGRYMVPRGVARLPSVFAAPLPFSPVFDYSYDGTMRSLEQSRMRLGLPRPDVVFIHDLDRRNHGDGFDAQFRIALTGAFRALDELRRGGDIGAIGIAVNEADIGLMMLEVGPFDCALLAGRYTLLDQSGLDVFLRVARARDIRVLAGGVFNSGILATGTSDKAVYDYGVAPDPVMRRVRAFERICARYEVPLAAVALQFVRAHPAIASILVGASRPQSVVRTVGSLQTPIPAALWQEIGAAGLIDAAAPLPV